MQVQPRMIAAYTDTARGSLNTASGYRIASATRMSTFRWGMRSQWQQRCALERAELPSGTFPQHSA